MDRRRLMLVKRSNGGRLPSEYQEVEYISMDGNQYVNANLAFDTTGENEYEFNFKSNTNIERTELCILGSKGNELEIGHSTTLNRVFIYNTGASPTNVGFSLEDAYKDLVWKCKISKTSRYIEVNGVSTSAGGFSTRFGLYLFVYNAGFPKRNYKGKIYYLTISDNGEIVRNFVPCYRKVDSVVGLYDIASHVFYENAGTGEFGKGADV